MNGMVKFYYGKPKDNESIATLLCGEHGLVHHLELALLFGFRSSRLFGRNLYVWDFIGEYLRFTCAFYISVRGSESYSFSAEKVKDEVNAIDDGTDEEVAYFCKLVREIQKASTSVGREGRFQVFVCVSIR